MKHSFALFGHDVPGRLARLTPRGRRRMRILLTEHLRHLQDDAAVPPAAAGQVEAELARYQGPVPRRRRPESAIPDPGQVRSPGGWMPPLATLPGWNWMPPTGATRRDDLIPRWALAWARTPLVDRYAYAWMWRHGHWLVAPAPASDDSDSTAPNDKQ